MRTAFRKNAETPQTSDVTAPVWEPWSTFFKVFAGFPVFWCFSSRDVLAQKLEVIYSLCVGKQRLCKWFFRDNWEVWSLLGLLGGKALDMYLFLLLKQESNAPTTSILGRKHFCFSFGLYILYKTQKLIWTSSSSQTSLTKRINRGFLFSKRHDWSF